MGFLKLDCQVMPYPWGSLTSIPDLLGRDNSAALPWAELWMGAHPKASATLATGERLIDFLRARGEELPFLFKILAADAPLSIQCHPDRQQAQDGFARENAAGIPVDAANRNYRDANHKPEIIVALEEFWALKGFREADDAARLFEMAGIDGFGEALGQGLETFCRALFALAPEDKAAALQALAAGCDRLPTDEAHWSRELLRLYPGDIGCLAPLFLQVIELAPGQALYLGAGELHAYLRGTGLELMANSDNVLRGGLTGKHVDTAELLRVLRFVPASSEILTADAEGRYLTPCDDFLLTRVALGSPQTRTPRGHEIWLCLGGQAQIQGGGETCSLARGEVALCSAELGEISVAGSGDLWIASRP